MNTHTTPQQQTIESEVDHNCKKARRLTLEDMLKIGEFRFLNIDEVVIKINRKKSTIYDWLNKHSPRYDPSFPEPVKLNDKSITWIFSEVEDWMRSKVEQTREIINP